VGSDHFQSNGAIRRRVEGQPCEFVFDVLVDGEPIRRDTVVLLTEEALRFGDQELPLNTVFWVSRRAGLMLLFGRDLTLAVLGRGGDLEELARGVERGSDRAAQRSLLQPLTREVVVCTAGTAVSGQIGTTRISGLHLAVFTQRGLHLFARSRSQSLEWPVRRVAEIAAGSGAHGRGGLSLTGDDVSLTLRYLFPEEIQAIAKVATLSPEPAAEPEAAIEMFARGEVAPPPPASLPEFALSAEALREAGDSAAARVQLPESMRRRLGEGFFVRHFQDLGEIALGPLMLRKSAAVASGTLRRAVEALDAEQLRDDAEAAFRAASEHLLEVYGSLVDAIAAERRLPAALVESTRAAPEGRTRLAEAFGRSSAALRATFEHALARQHLVFQRLRAVEHAAPETEEDSLEEAAGQWRAAILELDRSYGAEWSDLLAEMAYLWSDRFVPELVRLSSVPARRLSETARLAILATVTFTIVAVLAWWIL